MQEKPQRLDKFLTSQNVASRRDSARLIKSGKVIVDGETAVKSDMKIVPGFTVIEVCGEKIEYQKYLYIMMNKPKGLICATEDKRAETVLDILPPELKRKGLFPAGRLDKNTTGLLIITDDGEFAHKMLSPKKHVYKTYKVLPEREITEFDIAEFAKGIAYKDITFAPATLWQEEENGEKVVFVKIHEGKFHQVKRMFEAVGNKVLELERVKIGSLYIDNELKYGESRILTFEERTKIFE